MDLNTIKDAFDRVSKKQKLSSSTSQEAIDQIAFKIQQALSTLVQTPDSNPKSILSDLKTHLSSIALPNQLDINVAKYSKLLDKFFDPDISRSYRHVPFDPHLVNGIVADHFYREGEFDLGDSLVAEASGSVGPTSKSEFEEMHRILGAMKGRDLDPALRWASANRDRIGSNLEMKLHRLRFVEILQRGERSAALEYIRIHVAPFSGAHMEEIQKMMACLLWTGRVEASPYSELAAPCQWEKVGDEVWGVLGGSEKRKSPLAVVVGAGAEGLPVLLKLAHVMAGKQGEWKSMKQLPVAVELGKEYEFHSIFVCPVSREAGSDENPGMMMPCGHAVCRQSVLKLSKNGTRGFKCPYCPADASVGQCKQLYF